MPFLLLLIGAVIIIAAFNNSQAALVSELEQDVPPFLKWALAVVGVGALGWIPGMQTISRWLLALVMVVLFLSNWQAIIGGFTSLSSASGTTVQPATQTSLTSVPAALAPTGTASAGSISTSQVTQNINAAAQTPIYASQFGEFDPGNFLASFTAGFGGFGGIV